MNDTADFIKKPSLDGLLRSDVYLLKARADAGALKTDLVECADIEPRGRVNNWAFLDLYRERELVETFLIGHLGELNYMTSTVQGIDIERGLVKTLNSVYRIEGEPRLEPVPDLLLQISWVFDRWGVGKEFGTWLRVFY